MSDSSSSSDFPSSSSSSAPRRDASPVRKPRSEKLQAYIDRGEHRREGLPPTIAQNNSEPVGVKSHGEIAKIVHEYLNPLRRFAVENFGEKFLETFSWGKYSISFERLVAELTRGVWKHQDQAILEDPANLMLMLVLYIPRKYGHVAALLCYKASRMFHCPKRFLIDLYDRSVHRKIAPGEKSLGAVWKATLEKLSHNPAFKRRFPEKRNAKLTLAMLDETSIQVEREFFECGTAPKTHMQVLLAECHEAARLFVEKNPGLDIYHGVIGQRHYELGPKPDWDMSNFSDWLPALFSLVLEGDDTWVEGASLSMQALIQVARRGYVKAKFSEHRVEVARMVANTRSPKLYLDETFTKLFIEAMKNNSPPYKHGGLGDRIDNLLSPVMNKRFAFKKQ